MYLTVVFLTVSAMMNNLRTAMAQSMIQPLSDAQKKQIEEAISKFSQKMGQPPSEATIFPGAAIRDAFSSLGDVAVLPVGIQVGCVIPVDQDAGWGIWFYVGWGDPSPEVYAEVEQVVTQFHGALLTWLIRPDLNDRGAIISALPDKQTQRVFEGHSVTPVSLAEMRHELEQFSTFVRESLANPRAVPAGEQRPDATPFEDSIFDVFLVADPANFSDKPTSPLDRELHFGLTKEEWSRLSHAVDEKPGSLLPHEKPFLLDLQDRYDGAAVSPGDVAMVNDELRVFEADMTDPVAQKAIGRLRSILTEASTQGLGVVFASKD